MGQSCSTALKGFRALQDFLCVMKHMGRSRKARQKQMKGQTDTLNTGPEQHVEMTQNCTTAAVMTVLVRDTIPKFSIDREGKMEGIIGRFETGTEDNDP